MVPVDFKSLVNGVHMMVSRVKIAGSVISGRTLVQVQRYAGEDFSQVELLHPYGHVALPPDSNDGLSLQVGNKADHQIILGGDSLGQAPTDLIVGEAGLALNGGQQRVLLRNGRIEIWDSTAIHLIAPSVLWSPDGGATFLSLATQTHGHPALNAPPTPGTPALTTAT
jgi:phage gp45-like